LAACGCVQVILGPKDDRHASRRAHLFWLCLIEKF